MEEAAVCAEGPVVFCDEMGLVMEQMVMGDWEDKRWEEWCCTVADLQWWLIYDKMGPSRREEQRWGMS